MLPDNQAKKKTVSGNFYFLLLSKVITFLVKRMHAYFQSILESDQMKGVPGIKPLKGHIWQLYNKLHVEGAFSSIEFQN